MIVQNLLNWLSSVVAAFVDPIPSLPPEAAEIVEIGGDASAEFGATAAIFGPVIPYDALTVIAVTTAPIMSFWLVILGIRIVAWAVNR